MKSDCRKYIQPHIEVEMEREPWIKPVKMRDWLLGGDKTIDLNQINPKTLYKFIERDMSKFNGYSTL